MRKPATLILLFFSIHLSISSQEVDARMAYDSATMFRDSADNLWDKPNPSKTELTRSLTILDSGLAYLDRPAIFDLAQGSFYVKYRRYNTLYDLVHVYNLLGEKDKALDALQDMVDIGGYESGFILNDSSLANLRTNARFKTMMEQTQNRRRLWQGASLQTPYVQNLPTNEKIVGLSLLWSMAKYNFVHFDHASIDWDKTYLDYINLVVATKSTGEYYELLESFYAKLKDGHTNVYFPNEIRDQYYSRPPFRTELIEGRVFVTDIFSDCLKKMGITEGLEVLTVNNQPVLEYAKEKIEPYQSSSTPQDMEVRKFTYALLAGDKNTPVVIGFKDKKGKTWTQTIPRTGFHDVRTLPDVDYKEINNVGYLVVNSFGNDNINHLFDSLFPAISKTRALIIDLRKNGGGSTGIGYHILRCLTNKPFKASQTKVTQYNSTPGGDAQWLVNSVDYFAPDMKHQYSKPVIVLAGARTFSAAEDFLVAFDYMKRGKIVGQPTGGSTGFPLSIDLPGGGTARVCAKADYFPDWKPFVDIGIQPDVVVGKTIADLYAGKDACLDKALELLK